MPIPAASSGRSDTASAVLALFGQLHDELRREIEGLDEAETLRSLAGVPSARQRHEEFRRDRRGRAELLDQLGRADALIAELHPAIGAPRLRAHVALPTLPAAERRRGVTWLIGNDGHAREHVGHAQLTTQLYRAGPDAAVVPGDPD
jgi:hypothetical protein